MARCAPAEGIAPELTLGAQEFAAEGERSQAAVRTQVSPRRCAASGVPLSMPHVPRRSKQQTWPAMDCAATRRVRFPDGLHCCVAQSGRAASKGACRRFESFPTPAWSAVSEAIGRKTTPNASSGVTFEGDLASSESVMSLSVSGGGPCGGSAGLAPAASRSERAFTARWRSAPRRPGPRAHRPPPLL